MSSLSDLETAYQTAVTELKKSLLDYEVERVINTTRITRRELKLFRWGSKKLYIKKKIVLVGYWCEFEWYERTAKSNHNISTFRYLLRKFLFRKAYREAKIADEWRAELAESLWVERQFEELKTFDKLLEA